MAAKLTRRTCLAEGCRPKLLRRLVRPGKELRDDDPEETGVTTMALGHGTAVLLENEGLELLLLLLLDQRHEGRFSLEKEDLRGLHDWEDDGDDLSSLSGDTAAWQV